MHRGASSLTDSPSVKLYARHRTHRTRGRLLVSLSITLRKREDRLCAWNIYQISELNVLLQLTMTSSGFFHRHVLTDPLGLAQALREHACMLP
jgi:hypothetical protein